MLDQDIFAKLDLGVLKAKFFAVGTGAADGGDRIIYDDATGGLFYDKDGAGGAAQVQFAKLNPGTNIAADDFLVV